MSKKRPTFPENATPDVIFVTRVDPLQVQMHRFASAVPTGAQMDWSQYRRLVVRWELWGAAALITPLIALVLIVLKP